MTLSLMGVKDNPYFLVTWEAPQDIDTRSGWVTVKYEVRVKQEHGGQKQVSDWEVCPKYSKSFCTLIESFCSLTLFAIILND